MLSSGEEHGLLSRTAAGKKYKTYGLAHFKPFFCSYIVGNKQITLNRPNKLTDIYKIASRATQSNSVHVSVLQISTVHAYGVSKLLCQKFSDLSHELQFLRLFPTIALRIPTAHNFMRD